MEYFYAVVSNGRVKFAGGAEVQMAHLARGLVHQGFDVSAVTCDFGQPDGLEVDGIRLLRAYRPNAGLPIVRFFHPRLTLGVGAIRRADADVYLCKGASQWSGLVCDVAHAMGRKFVWIASHDHDTLPALPDIRSWRAKAWAKRGILGADAIVAQTEAPAAPVARVVPAREHGGAEPRPAAAGGARGGCGGTAGGGVARHVQAVQAPRLVHALRRAPPGRALRDGRHHPRTAAHARELGGGSCHRRPLPEPRGAAHTPARTGGGVPAQRDTVRAQLRG
jgi:hypothetical protein